MSEALSTMECLRGAGLYAEGWISLGATLKIHVQGSLRSALSRLKTNSVFALRAKLPEGTILVAVDIAELEQAVLQRMGAEGPRESIVWERQGAEMVVFLPVELRLTGGYLTARFSVETAETGQVTIPLVFFLGNVEAGMGKAASVTHDPNAPEVIMDAWGDTFRAVVWEGLLDLIEGAAVAVFDQSGIPLRVIGFTGSENRILIALGT